MFRDPWGWIFRRPLYRFTLTGRAPVALRQSPRDPWPGDPARGRRIVDEGSTAAADGDAAAAHDFRWLVDVKAAGRAGAAERARQLTADWLAANEHWHPLCWRADVLGQRLANWFLGGAFLLAGADDAFRARFLAAVAAQATHLGRVAGRGPRLSGRGRGRIQVLKGLVAASLALPGFEENLERALRLLEDEIASQVLADGGHASRSPAGQLAVLADLLEIRGFLQGARWEVPTALQGAIDRMTPLLRTFRHGDGRLALFNGSGEDENERIERVLAEAGGRGRPVSNAPHTGFQRLSAGRTLVIADTGPPRFIGDYPAHAGTLSIEVSHAKKRLIVNCGSRPESDPIWRETLRATAAHSTITVDDVHSSELVPGGGLGKRRAANVRAGRREDAGHVLIEASHDGYRDFNGIIHYRRLYLGADGDDLRGEDRLTGPAGHAFAARFHLHPDVQVSLIQGGEAALLRPAGGKGWRFRATGGALAIEESVYFGDGTRRRSQQLTVAGEHAGGDTVVRWRMGLETA